MHAARTFRCMRPLSATTHAAPVCLFVSAGRWDSVFACARERKEAEFFFPIFFAVWVTVRHVLVMRRLTPPPVPSNRTIEGTPSTSMEITPAIECFSPCPSA